MVRWRVTTLRGWRSPTGFTLVELLVVLGLVGILANFAVPAYSRALAQAEAADVVGTFSAVRVAALDYNLRTGRWPAERGAGEMPPELSDALAGQVAWNGRAPLDWENLVGPDGEATQPESGVRIGLSVRTRDPQMLQLLQASGLATADPTWGWGVTFVIEAVGAPSFGGGAGGDGDGGGDGGGGDDGGGNGSGNGNSGGSGNGRGNDDASSDDSSGEDNGNGRGRGAGAGGGAGSSDRRGVE